MKSLILLGCSAFLVIMSPSNPRAARSLKEISKPRPAAAQPVDDEFEGKRAYGYHWSARLIDGALVCNGSYTSKCEPFRGIPLTWISGDKNSVLCGGTSDSTVYCAEGERPLSKLSIKADSARHFVMAADRATFAVSNGRITFDDSMMRKDNADRSEAWRETYRTSLSRLDDVQLLAHNGQTTVCAVQRQSLLCTDVTYYGWYTEDVYGSWTGSRVNVKPGGVGPVKLISEGEFTYAFAHRGLVCVLDSSSTLSCLLGRNLPQVPERLAPIGSTRVKGAFSISIQDEGGYPEAYLLRSGVRPGRLRSILK